MPLLSETKLKTTSNFAVRRETKCMNCGTAIVSGDNMYSRRFCSDSCRLNYLL
ncbi:MAG: hypothetical protein ABH854_01615 [Candidatus Diapherotrites archaeon]|nr:hypothetical protein [Candidatus Micrarchaeota archaeon]MBU1939258.1 hypothetical protein [Candidatus Micrarchaeota archaeon]